METFNTPNQNQTVSPVGSSSAARHGYVINLSNHPSTKWSETQKEAALGLLKEQRLKVEIVDVPFPQLDPRDQGFEWENTIGMWLKRLLAKAGKVLVNEDFSDIEPYCDPLIPGIHNNVIFHIMGESVWTYRAVTYLKKLGFCCMASTTERKVTEVVNPDGTTTKTSTFDFVGFRVY